MKEEWRGGVPMYAFFALGKPSAHAGKPCAGLTPEKAKRETPGNPKLTLGELSKMQTFRRKKKNVVRLNKKRGPQLKKNVDPV